VKPCTGRSGQTKEALIYSSFVIPAKAGINEHGIQIIMTESALLELFSVVDRLVLMDSRLRGNDDESNQ
jgi:hypothetical protein